MRIPTLLIASSNESFCADLYNAFRGHPVKYQVSVLPDHFAAAKALALKSIQFDIVILDIRNALHPSGYGLESLLRGNPLGLTQFVMITYHPDYPEIDGSDRIIRHFTRHDDVTPLGTIGSLSKYEEVLIQQAKEEFDQSLVSRIQIAV